MGEAEKHYSPYTVGKEKKPYKTRNPEKMAARRETVKKHLWKPGQSGNPKGRPVNPLSLTSLLNKKLQEHPELADAIVNALIALGKGKDMRAIEMTFDRVDGKVVERHQIEGDFPVRIQFVPAQQLLDKKPAAVVPAQTPLELVEQNNSPK